MAPEFQKANEHLTFVTVPVKGRHPQWEAYYVNNSRRAVGLRNADMTEVLRQGMLLRCNTGRKAALQVKNRQRSQTPSIQGMWTPQLQDALSKQGAPSST
ncbi:hypothetical protein H632_c1644p1 [Helicosporidium sp. ATCC 50920]|nr:hypothetical protein H632_c1644p1 [Helicosporidium sp. ATCC 50920]|eukprot:KDD74023.1 hypothetical protein H632_c1644p1 [Helicosporidium sp. ATCC 50920]